MGALAIPLWAMWPSLALRTPPIPPLQTLAVAFACGWISSSLLHVHAAKEADQETPGSIRAWIPAYVYTVALSGGDLCFLLALHRIPAAQANLLSYL